MNEGWIKLHRSLRKWRWYKNPITKAVFIDLLFAANLMDHDFESITIHRGEVATSYNSIADANGISYAQARTAINHLKSTGEITVRTYPRFSVISIVNYSVYQATLTELEAVAQQGENDVFLKKREKTTALLTESLTGLSVSEDCDISTVSSTPKENGQHGQRQRKAQSDNSQMTVSQQQYKNDKECKNNIHSSSADEPIRLGDW